MISFPFDNASAENRDRAINSSVFADYQKTILGTNGIFKRLADGFTITTEGLKVTLKIGYAMIEGHLIGPDKLNETWETTIDAGSEQDRIDSIVLQLNMPERTIKPVYKKGTPATQPQPPELQRDAGIYEIQPVQFTVKKMAQEVAGGDIEDTRLKSEVCGIVPMFGSVDTTALYNQIQDDLNDFRTINEAEFDAWFADIQGQLDGDIAGKLQNQVTMLKIKKGNTFTIRMQDITIPQESWLPDEQYPLYPYKAEIEVPEVTEADWQMMIFTPDHTDRSLDSFFCEYYDTFNGKVVIYGRTQREVQIENIVVMKVGEPYEE